MNMRLLRVAAVYAVLGLFPVHSLLAAAGERSPSS